MPGLSNASEKIVFVAAKRTPFGAFGGSFKGVSATDLAVHAAKACLETVGNPTEIDQVIVGNVIQSSADAAYLARHVALKCGLPVATPAVTINRLCGSGFESIVQAAHLLRLHEATAVLAGGTENMSQTPYTLRNARFGYRLGNSELEDTLVAGLYDSYAQLPMGLTAEKLAEKFQITREESDAFALRSQQLAVQALKSGVLSEEIGAVTLTERGKEKVVTQDEHIRPEANLTSMASLRPTFKKDGIITAASSSGMVDGAAMTLVTTESHARAHNWPILGEFVDSFVVGCDPATMGFGPVPAITGLLKKQNKTLADMKAIEINEAFSPQVLSVLKALELPVDRVNTEGGAIAIGHPLGASGTRLTNHLLYSLKKKGGGFGLGSACIGGGQGIAVLVKV